ncbi:MAG: hypothetical protein LBM01_00945 [Christensenellaceae bacterium]|jgi:hypothetical protein|nr:hypothetical protein [Christensenellaceae bacterium]
MKKKAKIALISGIGAALLIGAIVAVFILTAPLSIPKYVKNNLNDREKLVSALEDNGWVARDSTSGVFGYKADGLTEEAMAEDDFEYPDNLSILMVRYGVERETFDSTYMNKKAIEEVLSGEDASVKWSKVNDDTVRLNITKEGKKAKMVVGFFELEDDTAMVIYMDGHKDLSPMK